MAWIGAAIGAVGGLLSSSGDSGGSSTSSESGPWYAAQPLLARQAIQANALQDSYTANPFNQQQLAAINNIFGQSDYMRQLVPSLLQQLSAQPSGFDPNNPTAKPKTFDFGGLLGSNGLQSQGLLAAQDRQNAMDQGDLRAAERFLAGDESAIANRPGLLSYGDLRAKK